MPFQQRITQSKFLKRRGRLRPASNTDSTISSHRTHAVHWLTQGEDGRISASGGGAFAPGGLQPLQARR